MATTFSLQFSCFFLVALSVSCQIQARESKFFFKYVHLNTNNHVTMPATTNLKKDVPSSPTPTQAPITSQISGVPASAPSGFPSAPAPAPATFGFLAPAPAPTTFEFLAPAPAPTTLGFLAPASASAPAPAPAPASAPSENEIPYYGTENPEELSNNRETYNYNNDDLSNNNGFWTSSHKSYYDSSNGYDFNTNEPRGTSGTREVDNENYGASGYRSEPQGMSDTRLGNNYYNVERENYGPNGRENNSEEGYYYGGNDRNSKYEFDSMEEYERQEGYANFQQEFINP